MFVGVSTFNFRKVPDQHVVDDRLLDLAHTAVTSKDTLDVIAGVASEKPAVVQN